MCISILFSLVTGADINLVISENVTIIFASQYINQRDIISVTFNDQLKKIERSAFAGCIGITSLEFPDSLEIIEVEAFFGCVRLKSITFSECLLEIMSGWSDSLSGYRGAFAECINLESLHLPDSLILLGGYSFYHCFSIKSLYIGQNLTSIAVSAFCNCSNLTEVYIPNNIQIIGADSFSNCHLIEQLTLSNAISINAGAFSSCSGLTSLAFPNSLQVIEKGAFSGCLNLKTIEFNEGLLEIGDRSTSSIYPGVFSNCIHLQSVLLPTTLTLLGTDSFSHCASLTTISLGKLINTVFQNTFYNCTKLQSLRIESEKFLQFSSNCFAYCSSLEVIEFPNDICPKFNVQSDTFLYSNIQPMFGVCDTFTSSVITSQTFISISSSLSSETNSEDPQNSNSTNTSLVVGISIATFFIGGAAASLIMYFIFLKFRSRNFYAHPDQIMPGPIHEQFT
jgi:hypothetical protein